MGLRYRLVTEYSKAGGSTVLMRLRLTGHSLNYNSGKPRSRILHGYLKRTGG